MASLPARPPAGVPPLPPGWIEHQSPEGHPYFFNPHTQESTYTRPRFPTRGPVPPPGGPPAFLNGPPQELRNAPQAAPSNLPAGLTLNPNDVFNPFRANLPVAPRQQQSAWSQQFNYNGSQPRGTPPHLPRGGHRGGHRSFPDRRKHSDDKPKHRRNIPNCAPWVLVQTKFKRRFVWNKETNESFWKFPEDVMKAVVEFDRMEREKKERRERGEPEPEEEDTAMAEVEAAPSANAVEVRQPVKPAGENAMKDYDEEEYEEVEVTDDEDEEAAQASKRQRTEEPAAEEAPLEMGEEDLEWQLAEMEAGMAEEYPEEEEGLELTEEDCRALFSELLDDTKVSPYTPWDKIIEDGILFEDPRYKALATMKARKECFDIWARNKIQYLKEQKANQKTLDPRIPYLSLLHDKASPKLYWVEFKKKFKKEPEMRDTKLSDKVREQLYRDHIKRLQLGLSTRKSDLSTLLKEQSIAKLNRSTTLDTLPESILTDLRFISLPIAARNSMVETYISTLPAAPEGAAQSDEERAEVARKEAEKERRQRALVEREKRVEEEKWRQERELRYQKGLLREADGEIERALRVGKGGLRGQLEGLGEVGDGDGDEEV